MSVQTWPKDTLGGLFDIGAGKAMSPSARLGERTYPFLRTANVFWGEVDLTKLDTMNFSEGEIEYKSLKKGDLLVCEGGDIGRSAIWQGEVEKCGFQNHIHRLRPKTPDVIPAFFMYYLQAGFTQLGIYEGAGNKTTIPNLSRGRLAVLEVPNPPKPEQEKIAAMLWKVQRAIQVEEKLTATARELKQSAMRQLFSHGLRGELQKETDSGLIPESWEMQPIRANAKLVAGGTPSRGVKEFWTAGTIPWVKTGEVDYCVITETEEKITPLGLENSAAKVLPKGTLLIAMYGQGITRGKVAILGIDAATNQASAGIIPTTDRLMPMFLYYYLSFSYDRLRSFSHGAQQLNLNAELVGSFQVPSADPAEQKEIVTILQTIDRKISLHERKRAALSDLFQTLLHQLMTAQIRVDKLDIDTSEVAA
jgi:type I restriction enzyme S subunit